jgi:parallel beta-helix repeat protein
MTIPQGASLTIASGQTIKLLGGANISVSGKLIANGLTFTAKDQASPWGGIYFSGAESSQSRLEGCIFNFANGYGGIVYIVDSSPTIKGCTFDKCGASCGIFIQKGSPIIQDNTINRFSSYGIYVEGSATPTVTGNTITNNLYGIYVNGGGTYQSNTIKNNSNYGLYYTGTIVIDATHCNWGDPSGPYDPSDDRGTGGLYNPYGKGDRVSDHVMYDLMGYQPVPGDVNHDGVVDLVDTVLSLQVLTGRMPAEPVYADADINNDGRLGMAEAIYAMQKAAGL